MYLFERKDPATGQVTYEEVMLERWVWGVVYHDGTELRQFEDVPGGIEYNGKLYAGRFHQLGEVKQNKVKMFVVFKPFNEQIRYDVVLPRGARLIHCYRNIRPHYRTEFVRCYIFGFNNGGYKTLLFILPDDRVVIADRDDIDLIDFNV